MEVSFKANDELLRSLYVRCAALAEIKKEPSEVPLTPTEEAQLEAVS